MPRRHQRSGRSRTLSSCQGDLVEVTKDETFITETTTTTTLLLQAPLAVSTASHTEPIWYSAEKEFLSLLKDVGAKGQSSSKGELFTFKQLGSYLKEYIKQRELYDVEDPAKVYCEKDPLGCVFGVKSFTFYDASSLLRKHIQRVDDSKLTYRDQTDPQVENACPTQSQSQLELSEQPDDLVTSTVSDNVVEIKSSAQQNVASQSSSAAGSASQSPGNSAGKPSECRPAPWRAPSASPPQVAGETSLSCAVPCTSVGRHGIKRKRQHRESGSSEGKGDERPTRRRSSSFVLIDDWPTFSSSVGEWWQYIIPHIPSPNESETYSVQSKSTVCVKSSSDEAWTSDEEGVQVLCINSPYIDPPFDIEYDVESDRKSISGDDAEDDTDSDTAEITGVLVVCNESDVEWWADSESSDSDSDFSSDSEIAEEDKWTCEKCGNTNPPIRSICDGCMSIRPDWHPTSLTSTFSRIRKFRKSSRDCTSSGEDECDGPPELSQNRLSVSRYRSTPNLSPAIGQNLSQEFSSPLEVPVVNSQDSIGDSGLEPRYSQDSAMLAASSQDSGINMDTTSNNRFDCSTPIENSGNLVNGSIPPSLQRRQTDPLPSKRKAKALTEDIDKDRDLYKSKSLSSVDLSGKDLAAVCRVCYNNPKDASIIHGNTGHQICCYSCAKKLRRRGKPCPYCRKKIQRVVRNFIV